MQNQAQRDSESTLDRKGEKVSVMSNQKRYRAFGLYIAVIFILALLWILKDSSSGFGQNAVYTYAQFEQDLETENVVSVVISQNREVPSGEANVVLKGDSRKVTKTLHVSDINTLQETMKSYDFRDFVVEEMPEENWLISILPTLILFGVLFVFYIMMTNHAAASSGGGSKMMNFGKSRAKMSTDENKKVNFGSVAGLKEEKEELEELVDFLRSPRKYTKLGARIPKGVLLVGPPGTGKTLLAKAVAGEANVPFFSISGSDFVEMFVGVGASRVRDMFKTAKENAPCIIFIDEIDAVGRQRGAGMGGGHDEREQTLNQLLVEMDGFTGNLGIIVMAATNRPDVLDPALLRPGRFDRQITISNPDVTGRLAILKVHARNKHIDSSVKLEEIAQRTPGFSGADIENLLNEAALLAARNNRKVIVTADIDEAIDRVMMGPAKKSKKYTEKERRLVAFHESGHAVIGLRLKNASVVQKVTIIPRGQAGGYNLMMPKEETYFSTKSELLEGITGLLGGRVAEALVLGDVSTGASNDIERASKIARSMVTKYGMSERLGAITFGSGQEEVFLGRDFTQQKNFSEETSGLIDEEVKRIIDTAYQRTVDILNENMEKLHRVAGVLLEKEKIDGEEFEEIMNS